MISRRIRRGVSLAGGIGLVALLAGCPFKWEKEERDNIEPNTYFSVTPPDTTFQNQAQFRWEGTDLDSDVVAYQFRLIQTDAEYYFTAGQRGLVLRSIVPFALSCDGRDGNLPNPSCEYLDEDPPPQDPFRGTDDEWVPRQTDRFETFTDLEDGWYEFHARSIDARGAVDPSPAVKRFYVFFDDKAPDAQILSECGRLGGTTFYTFLIDAADSSRSGPVDRANLEYSVQLRAVPGNPCETHIADPFTDWKRFPSDGLPVSIGNAPPTLYLDLFSRDCRWSFTLRVRDPAGNVGAANCEIVQQ